MAETFYPFVENGGGQGGGGDGVAQPSSPARIAVYDDMAMTPRVVLVEPSDIRTYLDDITSKVYELASARCDEWSFMLIREIVENFIHASFSEPTISILDKGRTLVFSDQGPGIPNKAAAMKPSFTSATAAMKRYIRGVGSGLPIVERQLELQHGTITIEDNISGGTIVTVSLAGKGARRPAEAAAPAAAGPEPAGRAAVPAPPYPAAGPSYSQSAYGYGQPADAWPQAAAAGQPLPAQPSYQPQYQQFQQYQQYQQPAQQPGGQAWTAAGQPAQPGYPGYPVYPGQPGYPAASYQVQAGYPAQAAPYPQAAPGAPGYAPSSVPGYAATGQPAWPGGAGVAADARPQAPARDVQEAGIDAHVPLTSDQREIVLLFAACEKVGPKELGEHLDIPAATGSRRLKELAVAGVVTKQGQKYVLTGEGRKMLAYLEGEGR